MTRSAKSKHKDEDSLFVSSPSSPPPFNDNVTPTALHLSSPSKDQCSICKCWSRLEDNNYGECRRFPPTLTSGIKQDLLTSHGPLAKFILTLDKTYCHEFQPLPIPK